MIDSEQDHGPLETRYSASKHDFHGAVHGGWLTVLLFLTVKPGPRPGSPATDADIKSMDCPAPAESSQLSGLQLRVRFAFLFLGMLLIGQALLQPFFSHRESVVSC